MDMPRRAHMDGVTARCLGCNYPFQRSTYLTDAAEDEVGPVPGDFTVCAECCKLHVFLPDMRVRPATCAETEAILASEAGPMLRAYILATALAMGITPTPDPERN